MLPSLDGRRFRAIANVAGADVGPETVFDYRQDRDLVHARYAGGTVRLGFLVGTRTGDLLEFRYAQLRTDGTTATGRCRSRIESTADGRLLIHETWAWESARGSGTSTIEEIP